MTFKESLTKLGAQVADLSQLEVITFTGTLKAEYGPAAGAAATGAPMLKWSQLITDSLQNPKGDVILAASTVINIDGDTYTFLSSDPAVPAAAGIAHEAAVKAGKEARAATFDFFAGIIKDAMLK